MFLEAQKSNKLIIDDEKKALDVFNEQLNNFIENLDKMMNETQVKNIGILTQLTISSFKSGIIANSILQSQGLTEISEITKQNKEFEDKIRKYQKYFDDTPNYIQ